MRSGEPFALAAIWDSWKRPDTSEWVRSFAVVTCAANELMAEIFDRMPVIIPPESTITGFPLSTLRHAGSDALRFGALDHVADRDANNKTANDDREILRAISLEGRRGACF
jgi:putative SOS response-associated peptidase YedK